MSSKKQDSLSQRMVIRPYVSWPVRLAAWLAGCLVLILVCWGVFEAGKRAMNAEAQERVPLKPEAWYDAEACAKTDKETLCAQLAELTRQFQILQTTNDDLAKQTRQLSKENSWLKSELDFFEHVMSGNTKIDNGVSIHHFNLKQDSKPGLYRYSLSLVQGGPRAQEFKGHLKFLVSLRQNDQRKKVVLTNKNTEQNFSVNFKFYHRIEENFRVPSGMTVESMEVQVFEHNDTQPRLIETVALSS